MQGQDLLGALASAMPVTTPTLGVAIFFLRHQEGSAGATTLSAFVVSGAAAPPPSLKQMWCQLLCFWNLDIEHSASTFR